MAKASKAKASKADKGTNKGETQKGGDNLARLDEYGIPKNLPVTVGENSLIAAGKEFKTGSVGYFCSGKILVGDVRCQVSMSITVIGSKGDK